MADDLTKALLVEEVVQPSALGEALFAAVTGQAPLVLALTDSGAVSSEVLARYLARAEAPVLRQVIPLFEVIDRLPPGLCARLFAVPVRRDAITGTIDVVVADPTDLHPASEISFHLAAPVRMLRAPIPAIEDALRRERTRTTGSVRPDSDGELYDSRPHSRAPSSARPARRSETPRVRSHTLAPPAPLLGSQGGGDAAAGPLVTWPTMGTPTVSPAGSGAAAPPTTASSSVAPSPAGGPRKSRNTPPWGTPIHAGPASSDHPRSGLGSEIPIPLTRRAYNAVSGGTQRPPPMYAPGDSLGEGIPVEPTVAAVELRASPLASFIPGPPPVPSYAAYAPQLPFGDSGGILAALRAAATRDEVLELLLSGARMVAARVAVFVVKRGGYLGWACTPEFGDRSTLHAVLVPLDAESIFDEASREGIYLGPIRNDDVHGDLLHVMRTASRDVAAVAVRVAGKAAVVVVADDLGDTMTATRRLEELARAAGDAFGRIVRSRR